MNKFKEIMGMIGGIILLLLWFQPLIVGVIDFTWNQWTGHSLIWNWDSFKYFYASIIAILTFSFIGNTSI